MKQFPFLIGLVMLIVSCETEPTLQVSTGYTQGTTYTVKYKGLKRDLSYQIDSTLLVFDRQLSTYIKTSFISKWNQGNNIEKAPRYFDAVVKRGLEIHKETDGAFDMTIAPLFSLWKMDENGFLPDSSQIDSVLQFIGSDKISLDSAGIITRSDERIRLDVNAIAQGYAVDVLADLLERYRVKDYLVEIGGEIRVKGQKAEDTPWKLAIDSPDEKGGERGSAIQFSLTDKALATSGNYRHYIESDGKTYGHIIDPRTGWPSRSDVLSASVIAPDCMTADALATAIMVAGSEFGKTLITENPDLEGVIITGVEGKTETWVSDGITE
ncbi:MAG: thiamine biosynthesis lipoprotein [Bacteroidia bacterium]|jgi:thiamine biosynthesis lipoprotein